MTESREQNVYKYSSFGWGVAPHQFILILDLLQYIDLERVRDRWMNPFISTCILGFPCAGKNEFPADRLRELFLNHCKYTIISDEIWAVWRKWADFPCGQGIFT
jgi:hypothetical protein